jgi:RNA polymerase sigma-70 factor (ECF subfamily)
VSRERQDDLYREAVSSYGAALARLAGAYEIDVDKRRDLLQEIHLSLWQSFDRFEGRCSLRTWVYRIAHNTSASYVMEQLAKKGGKLTTLEELEATADPEDYGRNLEQRMVFQRLLQVIHRLKPLDRQIILLYLEDMDAPAIGEVVGISPGHVRLQLHRIKNILSRRFHGGESREE